MSNQVEFLGKVPMFRTLSDAQLKQLAKRLRERTFDTGETIIEQGKIGIGLYIIVSGAAEVIRKHSDGSSRTLDTIGAYDFVGELSLLDDATRTASVIATEPVTSYVLLKLDLLDELQDEPQMAIEMLKELAARFRNLMTTL